MTANNIEAKNAHHCLKLANFMLRPSQIIIQALLLLVRILQDDLQPDAAWTFLSVTIRSAQILGMHTLLSPVLEIDSKSISLKRYTWYVVSFSD